MGRCSTRTLFRCTFVASSAHCALVEPPRCNSTLLTPLLSFRNENMRQCMQAALRLDCTEAHGFRTVKPQKTEWMDAADKPQNLGSLCQACDGSWGTLFAYRSLSCNHCPGLTGSDRLFGHKRLLICVYIYSFTRTLMLSASAIPSKLKAAFAVPAAAWTQESPAETAVDSDSMPLQQ